MRTRGLVTGISIGLLVAVLLCSGGCQSEEAPLATPSQRSEIAPDSNSASAVDGAFSAERLGLISTHSPRPLRPDDRFEDVTKSTGVEHSYHSGRSAGKYTMIEGLGGGVALLDYDRDGDLDLFCVSGGDIGDTLQVTGRLGRMFRNEGQMKFVDVTDAIGLADLFAQSAWDYSHGVAVGDVNGDQFPDLFITCYGRSRLLLNRAGHQFVDVTAQFGLEIDGWTTAACFADFNTDGWPDLYVARYLEWTPDPNQRCADPRTNLPDVCVPSSFPAVDDRFFLNQSGQRFNDVSATAGIVPGGKGLGVIAAHFNSDRHLDLYVANDVTANFLYLGDGDGQFVEVAAQAGVAGNEFGVPEGSMGVAAADVNHDHQLDLFVTNFELEDNDLFVNQADNLFVHATARSGLAGACKPYVGFGTAFIDENADGWDDLVIVNGHLIYRNRQYDYQQPAFLYHNQQGRFADVTATAGPWFDRPHSARGLAVGDLNNDGASDLVITQQDGPLTILQHRHPPANWIGIELIGHVSSDAIGATVTVEYAGGSQTRQTTAGGSYLSVSDHRLLFGLATVDAPFVTVHIDWPSGSRETFQEVATGRYHQYVEKFNGEPED